MSNLRHNPDFIVKFIVLSLIAISSASAFYVGDLLSWVGITYYFICALAILKDHPKAPALLWAAVAAHSVLVGYSLFNWYHEGIIPCPYCFASAGCILIAATARTKLTAAVLPAILVLAVGYSWAGLFTPKSPEVNYIPPVQHVETNSEETITVNTAPAKNDQEMPSNLQEGATRPAVVAPDKSRNSTSVNIKPLPTAGTGKTENDPQVDKEAKENPPPPSASTPVTDKDKTSVPPEDGKSKSG